MKQRRDSITADLVPFRFAYDAEHPMLWTLYDVLDAIRVLKRAHIYVKFNPSQWEPYLTLYHDKLINYYPGHPIHEQIATAYEKGLFIDLPLTLHSGWLECRCIKGFIGV